MGGRASDTFQKSMFYWNLAKTTQEDYTVVFWGVFGGVRFAHSHARGPVLVFCGGAPGYSKINQNCIIVNIGRAPEPFSGRFPNF